MAACICSRLGPKYRQNSPTRTIINRSEVEPAFNTVSSIIRAKDQALNGNIDKVMIILDIFTWLGRSSIFLCRRPVLLRSG
jgi:hypothetical protein